MNPVATLTVTPMSVVRWQRYEQGEPSAVGRRPGSSLLSEEMVMIHPAEGRAVPKIELAAAVVVLDNRILIVRRSKKEAFLPRRWGVPCGKIDTGEGAKEAVLRELKEETGLAGKVRGWAGVSEFKSPWQGEEAENIQQNFWVTLAGNPKRRFVFGRWPKVRTPRRDQRAKWVRTDRLRKARLDSHNLQTISQVLDSMNSDGSAQASLAAQFAE